MALLEHGAQLELLACPHCGVVHPNLSRIFISGVPVYFPTTDHRGAELRFWSAYACKSCGGVIIAESHGFTNQMGRQAPLPIHRVFPDSRTVRDEIPERPHHYLDEAIRALSTPSAALMVCASAVDAMLKERGLAEGALYTRIDKAAKDHIITDDMAKWAHHVRLEANGQRHADEEFALPTKEDAERSLEFALALAEFLFVLPARVTRGLKAASPKAE